MVDGAPVLDAARIGIDEVEAALGGLTPAKRHAAQLAADALHRALACRRRLATPGSPTPAGRAASLVAMSGGVDSAVAALLERERGAEVVGVTLKLWADPETDGAKACCSPEAVLGARAVAHSLGIPHLTLDLEEEFRRRVVGRFLDGYAAGATPNPCILCNGEVRLAAMVDLAERLGADPPASPATTPASSRTATGRCSPPPPTRPRTRATCSPRCRRSCSTGSRFPLTELTKPEVREIAARHGLAVARSPRARTSASSPARASAASCAATAACASATAPSSTAPAAPIGRHRGHHNFTVGQRRGIGVSAPEPLYVLATDAGANTVTVGTRAELEARSVRVRDAVLHRDGERVDAVRLRYHSAPLPATARRAPAPAATPRWRSSWARPSPAPRPARRRC